jgi:hypothetical protein
MSATDRCKPGIYKVGNQQFYLPRLFLVAALPLVNKRSANRMAVILLPAVLLLALYHFGYELGSDEYRNIIGWVRSYVGFIAFALSAASVTFCATNLFKLHYASCEEAYQRPNRFKIQRS